MTKQHPCSPRFLGHPCEIKANLFDVVFWYLDPFGSGDRHQVIGEGSKLPVKCLDVDERLSEQLVRNGVWIGADGKKIDKSEEETTLVIHLKDSTPTLLSIDRLRSPFTASPAPRSGVVSTGHLLPHCF